MDADRLAVAWHAGPPLRPLSVVVPAYNEAAGLGRVLAESLAALDRHFDEFEILVVDDGSADGTAEVAHAFAESDGRIRLLRHRRNRGYGAALRTGFEHARFDRVAFTDADGQFDLADLARLVQVAEASPIVVGYRHGRQDPWRRKFLSKGYNLLVRSLLGTRVRDCDCALKVFRRGVLDDLMPRSRGFFVNAEILTRARQLGHAVVELPVMHRRRLAGASTVSLADIPRTLRTLLRFWWREVVWGPRPTRLGVVRRVVTARVAAEAPRLAQAPPPASEAPRPTARPGPLRGAA